MLLVLQHKPGKQDWLKPVYKTAAHNCYTNLKFKNINVKGEKLLDPINWPEAGGWVGVSQTWVKGLFSAFQKEEDESKKQQLK
jgi:hypothetical protein